jgi:hypothetical protein
LKYYYKQNKIPITYIKWKYFIATELKNNTVHFFINKKCIFISFKCRDMDHIVRKWYHYTPNIEPLSHDISNPLPIVFWTLFCLLIIIRNEMVQTPWQFNLLWYRVVVVHFSIRGFNIPWGSKYHMTQAHH